MVSYAAMLGTFCLYFFGVQAVEPTADVLPLAIMGCILSVCSLFVVNNIMMGIKSLN
jgi:hypothetical protein